MKYTAKVYINHLDQMKPLKFIALMKMIEDEYKGCLSRFDFNDPFGPSLKITEKVDGSALRFGLNYQGDVFVESSTSPSMFSVGDFEARDKSKGYDGSIGRKFDRVLQCIQNDKALVALLRKFSDGGIKIIGEVLLDNMIRSRDCNLVTFIRIPYARDLLGTQWTFVPLQVLDGKGNRYAGEQCVIQALLDISTDERTYVEPTAHLKSEVIDLTEEIAKLNEFTKFHEYNITEILSSRTRTYRDSKIWFTDQIRLHQNIVRDKILSSVERGIFGPFIEGLVIEFPDRSLLKVITPEFKNAHFTQ